MILLENMSTMHSYACAVVTDGQRTIARTPVLSSKLFALSEESGLKIKTSTRYETDTY